MPSSQPPKGNSLHKKMSYHIYILKIGPVVFFTAHSFTQPPKSYALQCFSIGQTAKSAPSCGALHPHVVHVPWTHSIQHSKLYLDRFNHFHTAHSTESLGLYFTVCVKGDMQRFFTNLMKK